MPVHYANWVVCRQIDLKSCFYVIVLQHISFILYQVHAIRVNRYRPLHKEIHTKTLKPPHRKGFCSWSQLPLPLSVCWKSVNRLSSESVKDTFSDSPTTSVFGMALAGVNRSKNCWKKCEDCFFTRGSDPTRRVQSRNTLQTGEQTFVNNSRRIY